VTVPPQRSRSETEPRAKMGSTSGGSRVLVWLRFFPYADVTTDVTRLGWLSVVYSMYYLLPQPLPMVHCRSYYDLGVVDLGCTGRAFLHHSIS
jgi:hypothetical protein